MSIKKRRILVVDDEPDVNLTIKLALENEGLEADTFDKAELHCNGTLCSGENE
jgi:DNA-binding response OmpR family regulator